MGVEPFLRPPVDAVEDLMGRNGFIPDHLPDCKATITF